MFSEPKKVLEQVHIDHGMVVADFGSGTGAYALLLAELVGGAGKVFAYDIQKDLLKNIKSEADRKGFDNLQVVWADLDEPNSTSLKEEIVDRVFIINVMFQTEDKKALIRESKRILKRNGKVIVVDWSESFGGLGPRITDVVSEEVIKRIFDEEKFILEKEIDAGEHHYGLIFKKS
jgi:ubiquinone/menaquinone biosynthesis C-methylase UbiE